MRSLLLLLSLTGWPGSAQYFNPIVPANYQPFAQLQPVMYGQVRRAPPVPPPQNPLASELIYNQGGFFQPDSPASDFAAYQQNAALLQHQQPIRPSMNPYFRGALSPPPQPAQPMQAPVQVVYGRPQEEVLSPPAQPQPAQSPGTLSLPKFLEGVESSVVDQYKAIIRRPNSKYEDQVKELDQLVSTLDDQRQLLYRQFMQENDQIEDQHRKRVHEFVSQMSDPAQEQFAKISALLRNPAVPNEERWARVLSLYSKMEPKLRDEFENRFKTFE